MGERFSDDGIVAMVCHGDMGPMSFHVRNGGNKLSYG